jgi:gluconolactonase
MSACLRAFSVVLVTVLAVTKVQAQGGKAVVRLDSALDDIVPADAQLEKLADVFGPAEGPVWNRRGGYLLFSIIPANVIDKWTPDGKVSLFLKPSGFTGKDPSDVGGETDNGRAMVSLVGSNGITLDRQGRVVFCAHGDRAIVRLEKNGRRTILADKYEGKRLNSPNDLIYKSDGALYFTDPTAGLRNRDTDVKRELPFTGVYLLTGGTLRLLTKDLSHPNGLAFAPDEKYLYVNVTTDKKIFRYDVQPDNTVANGKVFVNMTADKAPGAPDGMKVDKMGNVYCTGPGGIWIISPEAKHLGSIETPDLATNLAFGDADGKTLFITTRLGLYRIHLKVPGIRP